MTGPLRYFIFIASLASVFFNSTAQTTENAAQQLKQAVHEKDYHKASVIAYELGKDHAGEENFEDAIKYLSESATYARKAGSPAQSLLTAHLLANVFFGRGRYSDAESNFEVAAAMARQTGSPEVEAESLIMQAKSLAQLKRYKRGIEVLSSALTIALEKRYSATQLACYELLSQYYQLSGNPKKSAEFQHLHATLVSMQENERNAARKVSELQNEIELEKHRADDQQKRLHRTEIVLSGKEDSLHSANQSLRQVEESLKELEEINHKRQLEIDLLSKEKELSGLRIQEQNSRLENEALLRNFILAVIFLGAALAVVIIIHYRKTVGINRKLDLQNKNIKSSINYAKRIQEAMLSKNDFHENALKDSFILFKPRDVVSGDFYWFSPVRNRKANSVESGIAFGAIDCTGHGVPGAFMSMIGINSLNTILNRGVTETNRILDSLHQEIKNALQQEVTGNNDGMDAALCIYRSDKRSLEFSGAKNPLVYIQNHEVHTIKGDIHPIGGSRTKTDPTFRKHEIPIETETMVYLFTDGYRDQFGGSENQKFLSKRFTKLLLEIHQLPLAEQKEKLSVVFDEWKGKNEQTDDVLVIGVRLSPSQG